MNTGTNKFNSRADARIKMHCPQGFICNCEDGNPEQEHLMILFWPLNYMGRRLERTGFMGGCGEGCALTTMFVPLLPPVHMLKCYQSHTWPVSKYSKHYSVTVKECSLPYVQYISNDVVTLHVTSTSCLRCDHKIWLMIKGKTWGIVLHDLSTLVFIIDGNTAITWTLQTECIYHLLDLTVLIG